MLRNITGTLTALVLAIVVAAAVRSVHAVDVHGAGNDTLNGTVVAQAGAGRWAWSTCMLPWTLTRDRQAASDNQTPMKPEDIYKRDDVPWKQVPGIRGDVGTKIFHRPGCRHYAGAQCTAEFQTADEARQAGYRECPLCGR
jgi:hypothetical protein